MKIYGLSAPIRNYGDVFALIFSHRRGARDAESPPEADLFAVERTANKKHQALGSISILNSSLPIKNRYNYINQIN